MTAHRLRMPVGWSTVCSRSTENSRALGLTVELGSGHRPSRSADVLVDRYLEDSERSGSIVTGGRPLVVAPGEALPFRDKAFEYSIALQVLEHSTNPPDFLYEVARVSKRGIIETPSPLAELLLRRRPYHRWVFAILDNELVRWRRDQLGTFDLAGEYFEKLYMENVLFHLAVQTQHSAFLTSFAWDGSIRHRAGHPEELVGCLQRNVEQLCQRSKTRQLVEAGRGGIRILRRKLLGAPPY